MQINKQKKNNPPKYRVKETLVSGKVTTSVVEYLQWLQSDNGGVSIQVIDNRGQFRGRTLLAADNNDDGGYGSNGVITRNTSNAE